MEFWLGWFNEQNEQIKAVATLAEQAGFHGVAVSDHVALPNQVSSRHPTMGIALPAQTPHPDPFTTIATMAAVTEQLRFMTFAYVLPMRDPFSVAKQVGALASMTEGRFDFGVATGWLREEMQLLGHDPATRGQRMDEQLQILQGFWQQGCYSFAGQHYQFDDVGIYPQPMVDIPILVGGDSAPALRRAARHDGWLALNYRCEQLALFHQQLSDYRQQWRSRTEGEVATASYRDYVVPTEAPSEALFAELEAIGFRGVVVMPWPILEPEFASIEAKAEALQTFSQRFIQPR